MSADDQKIVSVTFYQTENGTEPVREWLKGLDADDRKAIGGDIATVEYRHPVGLPICRPMGNGLYEVRSDLSDGKIARILFCFDDGSMVLLHGFIKKTQKTPDKELELARKRKREIDS